MELSEFVVPIENPKANKLIDLSNTILNNTEDYISKIEKYKVKLQHEKRLLIDKIQEFYS
jgi:hypothetical protein